MKRDLFIGIVVLAIVTFCWIMTPAHAADQLLTGKIDSATVAKDKNGNEYVRLIVKEDRTLNGVTYSKGIPVMAYRDFVAPAKNMRAGDNLKAVVSHSQLPDGRESYRIIALPEVAKKK